MIEILASELMCDPAWDYYREHMDELEERIPGIGDRLMVIRRLRMEISEVCWGQAYKGIEDMEHHLISGEVTDDADEVDIGDRGGPDERPLQAVRRR